LKIIGLDQHRMGTVNLHVAGTQRRIVLANSN
jgi:hypothetical protein